MRRSIRTRVILSVLALLVPLCAGAGWLLSEVFGNRLLRDIDVALQEEAETVAELASTTTTPTSVTNLVARIGGESDWGARKFVTVTRQGELLAEAPPGAGNVLRAAGPTLRIVHYQAPDSPVTVSIGVSAAAALHAQRRLNSLLAVGVPLALLLLATGLWLVIGNALRPLANAARRLEDVGAATLSVRLPVENPDDEVGRMVTVLNRMLDRLHGAVEELQRFTADAAHAVRTPLTVLRTGLEVALSRERSAPEYRAALMDALAGTERMWHLAGDLLTLARLEAAAAPRAAVLVDLGEVLRELADASEPSARRQHLSVDVRAAPGVCVRGDAGDLYRLFNNLIDNALRHSIAGGRLHLEAMQRGSACEVTVADSCPGIAAEDLPRIFDRFHRGNGAAADEAGTGLGLSIAQRIARMHGGRISAANRDGGGCVVTVTLPCAATAQGRGS
jgi:signal transduction histidine kinase